VSRLLRWYGASPLHLLAMIGSFALAGYAAAELLRHNPVGIAVWFVAAVIGHDLLLMPLYALADRSAVAVIRHRPLNLPAGPWINYLRVPAVLSGVLLLIWFPLIFRLPTHFPASTTLPLNPYLWHWLAVTGALFLLSATALALRLGAARRGARNGPTSSREAPGPPANGTPDPPVRPESAHPSQAPDGERSDGPGAHTLKDAAPPTITERVTEMAAEPANETTGAFPGEQADLAASVPVGIAPAGTILPDADLLDVHGAATTLYAATGDGPSVLVFYRGVWSPHRNIALAAYREQLLPHLTERGIKLVAISPQRPDGSLTMQQKHELGFTVVSDPANAIAGCLGLLMQPSDKARAAQLQLRLELTNVNADGTATLSTPATVILNAGHTVRWIDVHPDFSTRTEPQQVIDALDHLD
jgi:peroxiredoxin